MNNTIIEQALSQLAKSSDMPSNGTWGIKFLCSIYSAKELFDKDRQKLRDDIVKYSMKNEYLKVKESQAALESMTKPSQYLILRLEQDIPYIQGTKDVKVLDKIKNPEAHSVKYVHIMPDLVEYEFVKMETTGKMTKNINGDDTHVIEVHCTSAMLDVTEENYDGWGKKRDDARVWVTNVPFKLKQVIGSITGKHKASLNKLKGLMSEEEIKSLEAGTLHTT